MRQADGEPNDDNVVLSIDNCIDQDDTNDKGRSKRKRDDDDDGGREIDQKRPPHDEEDSLEEGLIPSNSLPNYLSAAFSELYEEDGLVVLGRGLGWLGLLAAFVRFYGSDDSRADDDNIEKRRRKPLVFVLNLVGKESQVLMSMLTSWGTPHGDLPRIITSNEGQSLDRKEVYERGGVIVITARILIVDLLAGIVDANQIDGMLVAHAEKVDDEGKIVAFILRIFRSQRYFARNSIQLGSTDGSTPDCGFIKAFTDNPSALLRGFAKVEKVLKALQVPKLYLYPRFHSAVAEELEQNPPKVEELHQPLTGKMNEIQDTLAAAIRANIRDLKQKCPLIDFSFSNDTGGGGNKRGRDHGEDQSFLTNYDKKKRRKNEQENWKATVRQCISTHFDVVIQRQLEGEWHRLSRNVKQSVQDLNRLRSLFEHLLTHDCVQFYGLLEGLKSMSVGSRTPSNWILSSSGEKLFRLAKERIYRIKELPTENGSRGVIHTVLEEKPKDRLLRQLLTELENTWMERQEKSDGPINGNILLMVKNTRALSSVQRFLMEGAKRATRVNWIKFLKQHEDKTKAMLNGGGYTVDTLPFEKQILYIEAGKVRKMQNARASDEEKREEEDRQAKSRQYSEWKRRHQRIIQEQSRGMVQGDTIQAKGQMEELLEKTTGLADGLMYDGTSSSDSCCTEDEDEDLAYRVEPIDGPKLFIRAFAQLEEGESLLLLNDIDPYAVILYDSDPSFIRSLEIYSNLSKTTSRPSDEDNRLQVFFLLYEACQEHFDFLKTLDREKDAFDRLIEHRKRMPRALACYNHYTFQEMQMTRGAAGSYGGGLPLSADTRTGGGKKHSKERRDIAVDVREFRSTLPSILHQGGMRLAPVTLAVGDFVLSTVHCVERKSISDLFQSFTNGRLADQAEAMSRHYRCPCLLIEFDANKTFSLQNVCDLGSDIRKDSITSKLTLLCMHFPKLRLLWSRSPHETLKLFKKLKRNHEEVNVEKAIEVGSNDSLDELLRLGEDGAYNEDDAEGPNETAKRMLLRLPGVNVNNARKIMSECDSIAALAELTREQLKRIAGPVAGQKLFTFFRERS